MESSLYQQQEDFLQKNSINRYLSSLSSSLLAGGAMYSLTSGS